MNAPIGDDRNAGGPRDACNLEHSCGLASAHGTHLRHSCPPEPHLTDRRSATLKSHDLEHSRGPAPPRCTLLCTAASTLDAHGASLSRERAALPTSDAMEGILKSLCLVVHGLAQCFQKPWRLQAGNNVSSRPFGLAECSLWLGVAAGWDRDAGLNRRRCC